MDLLRELYQALSDSDPADLPIIRRYIAWVQIRRRVHHHFYAPVHWVRGCPPRGRAHWVQP